MTKFKNKYCSETHRLQTWDYGTSGYYFITICTQNRVHFFGQIVNETMQLSEAGKIAQKYWEEIPKQFSYAEVDAFIIMPNHIHGIIAIVESEEKQNDKHSANQDNDKGGFAGDKNPLLNNNISRIVRWYKGRVKFELRGILAEFSWQANYHDHIIRDEESFYNIKRYIIDNPKRWEEDCYHS